jgi:cysteine synthase/rhodanese-related sulfurtransferase
MSSDHNLRVYDSILGLLSSVDNPTPLVALQHVLPFKHTKVYAKLEWYNPFGAVKDRVAANLLSDAQDSGTVGENTSLVEPTSGNTGLGLAMMANRSGLQLTTPLSKLIPLEKRALLKFFGAELIELDDNLCPAPGAPEGAISVAKQTAAVMPDTHMLDQYSNEANPQAHELTTGPEIWKQTEGKISHFIAALGTCGTITGSGRFLKGQNKEVQVLGVHPEAGHDIPGVRSLPQLAQTKLFHPEEYDAMEEISNAEAFAMCLRLNREESIIAGPSSGMALCGAIKMLPDEPGCVAVVIFPDNIFKYPSTLIRHFPELFRNVHGANKPAAPAPHPYDGLLHNMIERSRNTANTVGLEEAEQLIDQGALIVDVRSAADFEAARLAGAMHMPLGEIDDQLERLPNDLDRPIITVCNMGNMSLPGMLMLKAAGYSNAVSLNGGTRAWLLAGLPSDEG